ncbi:MAG: 4-hydroxy-tetrahydrodipicolinate synthase [Bacteroides sp.]|nr:4-hydroxy-tetrahydrodipicolinate synthase [Bacteroides sp.]MCM1085592.1 4-hydroxy-tetrahydrodipicolinate synthase [Bacteroides sp.]
MSVQKRLGGVGTALVTPFRKDGHHIDFDALQRIVDYTLAGGADFLVVLGTTGESPTLDETEKRELCRAVAEYTHGRVPLVMGIGGNNTAAVVKTLQNTDLSGYSYILSVSPFYNKPGQRGLYAHFKTVAENSPLPVIVYNIPSRCGANVDSETVVRLAQTVPNIAAVKEASGMVGKIGEILRDRPEHFSVFSGDDSLTLPLVAMGADGVISTAANLIPKEMKTIVESVKRGDLAEAQTVNFRIMNLLRLLFEQGNPPGIKAALHIQGFCENSLRLPLTTVTRNLYGRIEAELKKAF